MPTPFPVVLGHEGTGVVETVGSSVTGFRPGDRVVASLSFCGTCKNCLKGLPSYCPQQYPLNFGAQRADGSVGLRDGSGEPVHDHFFGQSSFAGYGLCRPHSLIKVPDSAEPDHVLAPLGCGVITGAGAVWNVLRVTPGSTVAVLGAGAVGLSAVMAASAAGAARIIVSDVHPSRLNLATQLGATDLVDATAGDTVEQLSLVSRRETSPECVDLVMVVRDSLAIALPHLERRGITLNQQMDGPVYTVGRRDSLGQVVLNLVFNAADACEAAGRPEVWVKVLSRGEQLALVVEDNGRGFDTRTAPSPDSFGLSGIRERTAACGGSVVVDAAPDRGTRIDIALPAHGARMAGVL